MRWKIISLFTLIAGFGVSFLVWKGIWIPNTPSQASYPIRGIDVSHHNGESDWVEFTEQGFLK